MRGERRQAILQSLRPPGRTIYWEAHVSERKNFTADEARHFGSEIGVDWDTAPFDVEQLRMGMDVELEHGLHDPATNVTADDPHVTARIAPAHLNEFADYTRLEQMEEEARRDWSSRTRD
jgi:hypothetical protein